MRNWCISALTALVLTAASVHAFPGSGNSPSAECTLASASFSDADAVSFCGALDVNLLANVCTPYVNAHLVSICRPAVEANAGAWCGGYVDQDVENRLNQRIGDIANFCGGDVDLTKIAFHLGDINARCRQAQTAHQDVALSVEQANAVALSTSQSCGSAEQTCEAAQASCTTSATQVVHCPDFQAACAKWVKRRRKYFVLDPVSGKQVPVIDRVTLCAKWVKPPVIVAP